MLDETQATKLDDVEAAVEARRKVTRLLAVWCATLSLLMLGVIGLSTVSVVDASRSVGATCHAVNQVIVGDRAAIEARVHDVRHRVGIYSTYTPSELRSTLELNYRQLHVLPVKNC